MLIRNDFIFKVIKNVKNNKFFSFSSLLGIELLFMPKTNNALVGNSSSGILEAPFNIGK